MEPPAQGIQRLRITKGEPDGDVQAFRLPQTFQASGFRRPGGDEVLDLEVPGKPAPRSRGWKGRGDQDRRQDGKEIADSLPPVPRKEHGSYLPVF